MAFRQIVGSAETLLFDFWLKLVELILTSKITGEIFQSTKQNDMDTKVLLNTLKINNHFEPATVSGLKDGKLDSTWALYKSHFAAKLITHYLRLLIYDP